MARNRYYRGNSSYSRFGGGNYYNGWRRLNTGYWVNNYRNAYVKYNRRARNWSLYQYGRFVRTGSFNSLTMY